MTVRTPVYWDGSSVKEMSSSMITTIIERCIYLYGGARSAELEYVASNGNLNRMRDTRDEASAPATNVSSFQTPGAATDATAVTTNDHINQVIRTGSQPVDTDNIRYPLYIDGTSGLRSMSLQDMKDTFIYPAILLLTDGNDRDGTYIIAQGGTPSRPNYFNVNVANPVFTDTRFDVSVHGGLTSSGEPHTVTFLPMSSGDVPDTPTASRQWYLLGAEQGNNGTPNVTEPLHANLDGSISTYDDTEFDSILQGMIKYTAGANGDAGYKIRYQIRKSGGTGDSGFPTVTLTNHQTKGDTMTDTTLNADVIVRELVNANDYRSRSLPTGSPETETEYELMIYRE